MVDNLNSSEIPNNISNDPQVHKYSNLRYLRTLRESELLSVIWSKLKKVTKVMSLGKKMLFYCCLYIEEEMQVMTSSPNDVASRSDQMLQLQSDRCSTEKFVDNLTLWFCARVDK